MSCNATVLQPVFVVVKTSNSKLFPIWWAPVVNTCQNAALWLRQAATRGTRQCGYRCDLSYQSVTKLQDLRHAKNILIYNPRCRVWVTHTNRKEVTRLKTFARAGEPTNLRKYYFGEDVNVGKKHHKFMWDFRFLWRRYSGLLRRVTS